MARRAGWPIASLSSSGTLGAVLALLVRDELTLFPYTLFALSVGGLFLTLPLLSDLGAIMRLDEGREWSVSLPATDSERTASRALHLLFLLGGLVLAWLVPFAALAQSSVSLAVRVLLPISGFGLALCMATVLIWAQSLLLVRLKTAFLLLQTAIVVAMVVGLVLILGHLPEIAALTPDSTGWLPWFPPAWFARPYVMGAQACWLPIGLSLFCARALLALPTSDPVRSTQRRGSVEACLGPLRMLAQRLWVRPDERGSFDLVYSALPREREVALRTQPMLGIPLAFLWISARERSPTGAWRGDMLALLFFTVGVYLPLLLTHVPLSESPGAAWILRTAPQPPGALMSGTIKALFVRWLLPLYFLLLVLAIGLGEADLACRLWLPAVLLALCLLRILYPKCVKDLPLSTAPEDLRSEVDWAGLVATLAVGLTLVAVIANRWGTPAWGMGLSLALLLVECALDWQLRRSLG